MTVYNSGTQYSTEQFQQSPLLSSDCWIYVYWTERTFESSTRSMYKLQNNGSLQLCGEISFKKCAAQLPPPSISTWTVSNVGSWSSRADMSVHSPTAQSFRSEWSWVMSTQATSYSSVHELSHDNKTQTQWVSEYRIYILLDTKIGHFGDESFQAITCTGTDNSKQMEKIHQKYKKHKIN